MGFFSRGGFQLIFYLLEKFHNDIFMFRSVGSSEDFFEYGIQMQIRLLSLSRHDERRLSCPFIVDGNRRSDHRHLRWSHSYHRQYQGKATPISSLLADSGRKRVRVNSGCSLLGRRYVDHIPLSPHLLMILHEIQRSCRSPLRTTYVLQS